MGILGRLARLDEKSGVKGPGPAPGQSRRDYLADIAGSRLSSFVPKSVYLELVELHDRVAALEAALEQLKLQRDS